MNWLTSTGLLVLVLSCARIMAAEAQVLYTNSFESAALDKVPDDFMVLEGGFEVKAEDGNRFLELPGAPLESFGVLFGPTDKGDVVASARIYATGKSRRYPTFGLGVNGVGGYKLQVTPAKNSLELYRADTRKAVVPYKWSSGKWTHLKIEVRKTATGWDIKGKAWTSGDEPANWMITTEDQEDLPAGRGGIFASPFSGTPIRFDDLTIARAPSD
jgi:hypothetical protein